MKSLFFEDISVGMQLRTSTSRPFTEEVIDAYFELTGDRFNIHSNDEFARRYGLPAAMVPGNLVVAVATGLVFEAGYFSRTLVVQARKAVSFVAPVFVGDSVYVTETVTRIEERCSKPYGRVVLKRSVFTSVGQVVQLIDQDYRIAKRSTTSALLSKEEASDA